MGMLSLISKIMILAVFLIVLPWSAGEFFTGLLKPRGYQRVLSVISGFCVRWLCGQFMFWGLFQLIGVGFILKEKSFALLVPVYLVLVLLLSLAGFVAGMIRRRKRLEPVAGEEGEKKVLVLWLVVGVLLFLQLVQAVRYTYADGDDAYYVAVSAITENAETMYQKLPYTGGTTEVDIRHGLAPFPIWIAFLSRISGISAVSTAHVAVPLVLIPMTYAIFFLISDFLFRGKKNAAWSRAVFMIFTEVLVLFGDYSLYSVENFMLARSRQGKAALGSIVIPMLFLLLFALLERMEKGGSQGELYGLLFWVVLTGCLCSTMGAFLLCLLIGVTGVVSAICYRRWKILIPLALCCVPSVLYAVIYILN